MRGGTSCGPDQLEWHGAIAPQPARSRSCNDSCRGVPDPSSGGLPGPCDKDVDRGSSPTKPLRDEATDRTVYVPYELFVGRLIDEIVAGPS